MYHIYDILIHMALDSIIICIISYPVLKPYIYNILIQFHENSMALDAGRQEMGHTSEMWFHPKGAGARAHMDGECNVFSFGEEGYELRVKTCMRLYEYTYIIYIIYDIYIYHIIYIFTYIYTLSSLSSPLYNIPNLQTKNQASWRFSAIPRFFGYLVFSGILTLCGCMPPVPVAIFIFPSSSCCGHCQSQDLSFTPLKIHKPRLS